MHQSIRTHCACTINCLFFFLLLLAPLPSGDLVELTRALRNDGPFNGWNAGSYAPQKIPHSGLEKRESKRDERLLR